MRLLFILIATIFVHDACAVKIANIQVVGNNRIESATVIASAKIKLGQEIDLEKLDNALKNLYNAGYFSDVKVTEKAGVVVISVQEHPMVSQIFFDGNKELNDKLLKEVISLKERRVYSDAKLKSDAKVIQDIYRLKGRFSAKIVPQLIRRDQNRVDVVFAINEGQSTTVKKIVFVGNKAIGSAKLEQAIQTKESKWYRFFSSDDTYDPDKMELDKEKLRAFYLDHGYVNFSIKSAIAELTPDMKSFIITFVVQEGKRFKVNQVDIQSSIDLDLKSLQTHSELKAGDWYSASAIEKTINNFTVELGEKGFAFVDIRPDVEPAADHSLNIKFTIQPGPHVYINKIRIKGNHTTDDDVIRRELRVFEGDAFNAHKIRRSERAIRYLGFFKKVEIKKQPTNSPDQVDLLVDLQEESSTGEVWIAAGYSTVEGILGEIGAAEHNFMGRGQDVSLRLSLSQKRRAVNIGFTEPYFCDRRLSAGVNLHHEEMKKSYNETYAKESNGVRYSLGYDLAEYLQQTVYYGFAVDNISHISKLQSPYVMRDAGSATKSYVGHRIVRDTRDNRLDPRSGYYAGFGNETSGVGGGVQYHKHELFGGTFVEMIDDVVLNLAAQGGMVRGYSNKRVRLDDRYNFGGDGSIRGFRYCGCDVRDATTKDPLGVMQYYLGSAEISFPLGLPNELAIRGFTFVDVGSGWGSDVLEKNVLDSNGVRASVGAGLLWKSPFGPMRIHYATALKKAVYDRVQQITFGFSTKF